MKAHNWVKHDGDGGHVGAYEYWECSVCGACAGVDVEPQPGRAFLADGSGLQLVDDCDMSGLLIDAYKRGIEKGKLEAPRTAADALSAWRAWLEKAPL